MRRTRAPSVWRNNAFKGIPGSSGAKTRSPKNGEGGAYLADPVMEYMDSGDRPAKSRAVKQNTLENSGCR